ncbi:MAG: hypothetical protein L3J82_07310 [Planctomycetes bacterium]|nr:hypothetical protein [Planctomycetota bacterium]
MKNKESQLVYRIGFVVSAVAIGLIIAMAMAGGPAHIATDPVLELKYTSKVDDDWGKLPSKVSKSDFRQIVIGWKGVPKTKLKDKNRNKELAREMIEQAWHFYRNDPTAERFIHLQIGLNEDFQGNEKLYLAYSNAPLEDAVIKAAQSTKKGFARIVESKYGFHLIRREK